MFKIIFWRYYRHVAEEEAMPYSPKQKHDTREKILESARRLFNRKGYSGVSIEEIMSNAGLTHGGFYRHFTGKDELYAAAVRQFLCKTEVRSPPVSPVWCPGVRPRSTGSHGVKCKAMQLHLEEIATKIAPGTHAILILDQAGWHGAKDLRVPSNISLLPLPPRGPEPSSRRYSAMRRNGIQTVTAFAWAVEIGDTG
jgi:hypothetical protein